VKITFYDEKLFFINFIDFFDFSTSHISKVLATGERELLLGGLRVLLRAL